MKAVTNAGPLIASGKFGLVHLLNRLYDPVLVPSTVYWEVVTRGLELGQPDAYTVQMAVARHELLVLGVEVAETATAGIEPTLQLGERITIQLAMQEAADWVLLDDQLAREQALGLGLHVKGTLGVIVEAYRQRLLTAAEVEVVFQMRELQGFSGAPSEQQVPEQGDLPRVRRDAAVQAGVEPAQDEAVGLVEPACGDIDVLGLQHHAGQPAFPRPPDCLLDQPAANAPAAEGRVHGDVPEDGEPVPVLMHQDLAGELAIHVRQPRGVIGLLDVDLGVAGLGAVAFDIRLHGTHGVADPALFGVQAQLGLHRERVVAAVEVGLIIDGEPTDEDVGQHAPSAKDSVRRHWVARDPTCCRRGRRTQPPGRTVPRVAPRRISRRVLACDGILNGNQTSALESRLLPVFALDFRLKARLRLHCIHFRSV